MDEDLKRDIIQLVESNARLRILPDKEAGRLVKAFETSFVEEPTTVWWWESLKVPCRSIEYDSDESLHSLKSLLREKRGKLILAVTDDEPPPWMLVEGEVDDLLGLVGELRYFEYFVADGSARWIVFDTHHNQFVVADASV